MNEWIIKNKFEDKTTIYDVKYNGFRGVGQCVETNLYRTNVIEFVKNQKKLNPNYRVVDIGGYASGWSSEITDAIIDINYTDNNKFIQFNGNICYSNIWMTVMKEYVDKNGKFDFSICTHTLEDIASPKFVCDWIEKISDEGFIAMPSKYIELSKKCEGYSRGYMHHRWIFNHENNIIKAYPKLPFLEHYPLCDKISDKWILGENDELQWFWKEKTGLTVMNEDFCGPTAEQVIAYYNTLLD